VSADTVEPDRASWGKSLAVEPGGTALASRRLGAHLLDLADEPVLVIWTLWWIRPTASGLRLLLSIIWVAWVAGQLVAQAFEGQTVGKRLLDIHVVCVNDSQPLGLSRTLARWLLHGIDTISVVGWIATLVTNRSFADRMVKSAVKRVS